MLSFLRGDLRPALKSDEPPAESWEVGTLRRLVGDTLESEATVAVADVLLCFHSPYEFVHGVNKTLTRLASILSPVGVRPMLR